MPQPLKRDQAGLGMASVERSDTHRKRQIIGRLVLRQNEILDGDTTECQPARRQLRHRSGHGLIDGLGGTVDSENVPLAEPLTDRASDNPRTATDLENAHAGMQRKRLDYRGKPGRNSGDHG